MITAHSQQNTNELITVYISQMFSGCFLTPKHLTCCILVTLVILVAGVGGHGGSGIHADLADKYQEILQRVSCYASTLPPEVSAPSPRPLTHSQQSVQSDSPRSAGSQPEAILIEGYGSDYSAPSNRVMSRSLQRTPPSSGHSRQVPVEQVHITKCTVCVIL